MVYRFAVRQPTIVSVPDAGLGFVGGWRRWSSVRDALSQRIASVPDAPSHAAYAFFFNSCTIAVSVCRASPNTIMVFGS
jgi:hypothetical protein